MNERPSNVPPRASVEPPSSVPLRLARPRVRTSRPIRSDGPLASALLGLDRNPLARIGFFAIASLALVAVFADVLASDLPVACHFKDHTYFLPSITRPVGLAGYDCERIAEERGPGEWALFPLVRHGPLERATPRSSAPDRVLEPPRLGGGANGHFLGTDARGRDTFARLVHGARTSLTFALAAALGFVTLGAFLGALGGFFGGVFDAVVARLVESLTAFPTLVLVLVVQAALEDPGPGTLLFTLALTRWTEVARLVRAEVLLVTSQDYVLAARALGASPWRILRRHVLPNARGPILVATTLGLASVLLLEAALDFLRVGVSGGAASWGEMLSEVRDHPGAWWLLVFPGLAVFLSVAALNLLGEALRDVLDPRLRLAIQPTKAPGSGMARGASDSTPPTSAALE